MLVTIEIASSSSTTSRMCAAVLDGFGSCEDTVSIWVVVQKSAAQ
jgi:hypothetical protein